MRLDRLDLNLLVVFEAIYSEGNLTRVSEQLNVAQPTVSNSLARLRVSYDDQLFVRVGREMVPTPLARRMVVPVRSALKLMQATLNDNVEFHPATSDRTFQISVGESPGALVLPELMAVLSSEAPNIKINTHQLERRDIKEALGHGELDLAIDIPQLSARVLNRHALISDNYVCVVRKRHPQVQRTLTLDTFLSLSFVSVSSRASGSSVLDRAMNRANHRIETKVRTQYYLPAMQIVERTDHALVAPRALASQFDLVLKTLPIEIDVSSTWLYWHPKVEDDPANKWLRSVIIRVCGET